jgi:segregation and condensation protein B
MENKSLAEVARLFPQASNSEDEVQLADPNEAVFGEAMRIAEAMLFAAAEPLEESEIGRRMPEGMDVVEVLTRLKADYAPRGVNLLRVGKKWLFRTAGDLGWLLARDETQPKKLSRAALETLAIVAYHQPVTRAEIEEIRGVSISKGTMDVLIETGWVRLRGRRRAPGRPVTYGTTEGFLLQFGLEAIADLPGLEELKGAGLYDGRLPNGFSVPMPSDDPSLTEDEDPLDSEATTDDFISMAEEPEAERGEEGENEDVASEDADGAAVDNEDGEGAADEDESAAKATHAPKGDDEF